MILHQRLSEYLSEMVSVIRSGGVAYLVDCGKDEYSLLKRMGGIKIVNATEIERNGGEYFTVKLQKL